MRNLKRLLTLGLAGAMLVSLMIVGTTAAFDDQAKIENATAVNMNVALGIINGRDDGTFDPEGNVTRAEMCKMICVALNGGEDPKLGSKATATFTDITGHWAEGYIEYCAALGVVAGMGDGTFNPNGNVTATQVAKMILVALGYEADTEGFNGATWAVKINVVASQNSLYKDVAVDPNAALSRDDAAQMLWNGLNAKMVKYDYSLTSVNGTLENIKVAEEYDDDRTLLSDKYDEDEFDGQLVEFTYNSSKEEWTYTVNDGEDDMKFTTEDDFTNLYGHNVNVVYKLDGSKVDSVYGIYADESVVLFSGVVNDLSDKTDEVKFDGTEYDLDNDRTSKTNVYEFTYGKDIANAKVADLDELDDTSKEAMLPYSFDAIDYDDDGEVDFLIVYPFTVEEVTYLSSKKVTAGSSYTIDDCDVYDDIAKDDYTKITAKANTATNTTRLDPVDSMIDGKVKSNTGDEFFIDGTGYYKNDASLFEVGDSVKDAPVVNGFIFDADTSGNADVDEYAVVVATESGIGSVNGARAKLMFSDGTKKVVETDKHYDGIPATEAGEGDLVTFDINSDDEYELTKVDYVDKNGFDAVTKVDDIDDDDHKVDRLDGFKVPDEAVIFVKDTDGYDVITGATLKDTEVAPLTLVGAFAEKASSSGYYNTQVAYITSTSVLSSADYLYAYAVDDYGTEDIDGDTIYYYDLWDGTGDKSQKIYAEDDTIKDKIKEGNVVKYTLNGDGEIDDIEAFYVSDEVVNSGTHANNNFIVAITAFDDDYIQVNRNNELMEIDDDTVILYVDNEDVEFDEDGSIQLADEDPDDSTKDIPNAFVITDDPTNADRDGDVAKLIVVDINNQILRDDTTVGGGETPAVGTDGTVTYIDTTYVIVDNQEIDIIGTAKQFFDNSVIGVNDKISYSLSDSGKMYAITAIAGDVTMDALGTNISTFDGLTIGGDFTISGNTDITASNVTVTGNLSVKETAKLAATHFTVEGTTSVTTSGAVSFNSELEGNVTIGASVTDVKFTNVKFGGNVVADDANVVIKDSTIAGNFDAKGKAVTLDGAVTVAGTIANVDSITFGGDASQAIKDAVQAVVDADAAEATATSEVGTEKAKVADSYVVPYGTENTNAAKAAAAVALVEADVNTDKVNVAVAYDDPNIVVTLTSKDVATVSDTKNITVSIATIDADSSVTIADANVAVDTDTTITVVLVDTEGNAITGLTNADFTLATADSVTVTFGDVTETSTEGTYTFTAQNSAEETEAISVTVKTVDLNTSVNLVTPKA